MCLCLCVQDGQPATRLVQGMHTDVCTKIVISEYQPLNSDDQSSSSSGEITIRDLRDCPAGSTFETETRSLGDR